MCMAREEWYSLYTDAVETIWREERTELKKAVMLIHILGLELSRVKEKAEKELNVRREQLFLLDNIKMEKESPKVSESVLASNIAVTPLIIPKVENITDSFISPDLFRCDSPDFPTTANLSTPDIDENNIVLDQIDRSPKINRSRNLFHIKRSKENKSKLTTNKTTNNSNNDMFKCPFIKQPPSHKTPNNNNDKFELPIVKQEVTPTKEMDEIIQATPAPKKPKLSMIKSQKKLKQSKLINNTLTQMFPQSASTQKLGKKFEDSDATYCDVTQNDESKFNNILHVIGKKDQQFIYNYDIVPEKVKPPAANEGKKPKCKKCLGYGIKCPQHKILSESYNKTYSGFWDVDFTVDDPNRDDSDDSTIF